jgi:predicted transcriptional regulator of viral defense system
MVADGRIEQLGRGLYTLPDGDVGERATLAEASLRAPGGVICLLSALRLHELTTENPKEVWIAVGHKSPISVARPRLRVVRMSPASFAQGVEEREFEGIPGRVFSVAKTIADCFKFRGVVGLDVAMEALKEGWRRRAFSMDDLWRMAEVCRVAKLMRPYLEML